jgi:hypothetical protein
MAGWTASVLNLKFAACRIELGANFKFEKAH